MGLWALIMVRLAVLSGERLAFHGLGRGKNALATTAVAYGGATVLLWLAALLSGHAYWVGLAFWPGAIYAVSFVLYTAALAKGPVSVVSAFSNATAVLLFFSSPVWDWRAWAGIALFALGGAFMVPWRGRPPASVLWMLLSDVALAVGRLLDAHVQGVDTVAYAASLFTSVTVWLVVPLTAYARWGDVRQLMSDRPGWSLLSAGTNGLAYLTVFELLKRMPATMVEAVSAWAGVLATVAGLVLFHEGGGRRKIIAAVLMTVGTVILLFSRLGRIG